MANADESTVPLWWVLFFVLLALALGAGTIWALGWTFPGA